MSTEEPVSCENVNDLSFVLLPAHRQMSCYLFNFEVFFFFVQKSTNISFCLELSVTEYLT